MALNPYETPRGRLHFLAEVTRRQFFLVMGWLGAIGALIFGGAETIKFLFPSATLEEPQTFKVEQDPASIGVGTVIQITDKRVSIVHDKKGIYAVYLVCTHLGCTPNYTTTVTAGVPISNPRSTDGWACPCHGSRYFIDSTNFYGPAPRPMDWVDVSFTPDGKLQVNRGKLVVMRGAGVTVSPEWRLDPNTKKDNGKTMGV